MAIDDAYRTDVVALAEQRLQHQLAIAIEPLGVNGYFHAFLDLGDACGQQFVAALDLHHAQAAGSELRKSLDVTEPRNLDVILQSYLQDSLLAGGAHVAAFDLQRFDLDLFFHAPAPTGLCCMQVPAPQCLFSMCS